MITIDFSKRGSLGLCEYLYSSIKTQILDGTLRANEKLPSKRALSENLGVSVITVQNAYAELIAEGYIYSIEKKGFFVTELRINSNDEIASASFRNDVRWLSLSKPQSFTRNDGDFENLIVTENDGEYIFYEAKFKNAPLDKASIEEDIKQVQETGFVCKQYGFFSKSEFTNLNKDFSGNLILFTLEDLFE